MSKPMIAVHGVLSYLVFLGTFVYLIGFLAGSGVPKGVDSGPAVAWPVALAVDLALIALFGLQHSVMARAGFKRFWTRFVPEPAERSTYVLVSSLALIVLYVCWRPLPATLWSAHAAWLRGLLWAGFVFGWGLLFVSTFLIDHFELFGLRQVWNHWHGTRSPASAFKTPGPYRWVRHPMMSGFLLAFWSVPQMSAGHALFSAGMSAYIVLGTICEERDLIAVFGQRYRKYAAQVPRFSPSLKHAVGRPRA